MPDRPWNTPKNKDTKTFKKGKLSPEGLASRRKAINEKTALRVIEGGASAIGEKNGKYSKSNPDKPLTPKQEHFVNHMLKGTTATEAYRQAYNTENMNDHTIRNEAARLMGHPGIGMALEKGFKAQREKAVHSAASLRLFVQERLYLEATQAKGDAARIRALELIGKMQTVALFSERIETEDVTRSAQEIREELQERLEALLKASGEQ